MTRYLLSIVIAFVCSLPAMAQDEHAPALAAGTTAPLFNAPDTLGQKIALKDFRGSWLCSTSGLRGAVTAGAKFPA